MVRCGKLARQRAASLVVVTGLFVMGGLASTAHAADGIGISDDGAESSSIDELLAPTVNDPMYATLTLLGKYSIDDANGRFRGAYSLESTDDGKTLILRYAPSHPLAQQLVEAVKLVQASAPVTVELEQVDFDLAAHQAVAQQLMRADSVLVTDFGLTPTIAVVDQISGRIVVETSDTSRLAPEGSLGLNIDGVDVDVRVGGGEPVEFQVSRNADLPNWSAGITLDNGSVQASMGFTWQRWSDGERMGSTAEHAYQLTGVTTWYNNGLTVGTRYFYSVARDAVLLRGSPLSSFNSNMYIGSSTTSERRNVVGALNSLPTGTVMALNARWGLRPADSVFAQGAYTQLGGGPFVLTTGGNCSEGDSGGPWIQTNGSGQIIGTGSHVGRVLFNSIYRCVVSPLGPISSTMAASIATG